MSQPFLDFLGYLNIHNANRIADISAHDPFAVFGFVLLLLIIPLSLVLLTITARRAAATVWDTLHHEARFRSLARQAARQSLLPVTENRTSFRSNRATVGSKRVSFMVPESPRTPKTPQTPQTPRMLQSLHAPPTPHSLQISRVSMSLKTPTRGQRYALLEPVPEGAEQTSPTGSSFEDVYDRWVEAQKPPQVDVTIENEESKRRWTVELQRLLKGPADAE